MRQVKFRTSYIVGFCRRCGIQPEGWFGDSRRLIGHAAQNRCVLRFITIINGEFIIDKDDIIWKFLCALQELLIFMCAKVYNDGRVTYLKLVIEEYLYDRNKLFLNIPFCPQHHYLLHYPSLILRFGCIIWFWIIRFESKHSFFKKASR